MADIILSIHKRHAEKILSGEKTLEIRKTYPCSQYHGEYWIYLYETKARGVTGAIIGRVWCSGTLYINQFRAHAPVSPPAEKVRQSILQRACLTAEEMTDYAAGGTVYGFKLERPEKFETPMQLSYISFKRAPQSWMYMPEERVEE